MKNTARTVRTVTAEARAAAVKRAEAKHARLVTAEAEARTAWHAARAAFDTLGNGNPFADSMRGASPEVIAAAAEMRRTRLALNGCEDSAERARVAAWRARCRLDRMLTAAPEAAPAEAKPEAAAPALRHSPADLAAAFRKATEAALSDMEAAAARDTAARAARLEALEAPRRAAYAAEAAARISEAAEARKAAFAAWQAARAARFAVKPFPLTCPVEAAAWEALQAAEARLSRVTGQSKRRAAEAARRNA